MFLKHGGYANHRATYQCWQDMKQRCLNPRHKQYKNYGMRGISVCDRWLTSFENFFEDMGEKPDGLKIERINNDLGYMPGNCKWATQTEQSNNQRRNHYINFNGKRMTLTQWANRLGIHTKTIEERLKRGWSLEKTLTTRKMHSRYARASDAGEDG